MRNWKTFVVVTAFAAIACRGENARAEGEIPDLKNFYELTTDGSAAKAKPGETATLVLQIHAKNGAHVSGQSPLTVKLKSTDGLELPKAKLKFADAVSPRPKGPDGQFANVELVKFEVPVTAKQPGAGKVTADLKFFVCTPKPKEVCAMESRTVELPVDVK